jgi:pyruvate dehydrogenase E2 component (dihydrolipoamide acetyltransferase)
MAYEFRLPDVGEGIAEAEIVRWLVQPGDHVKRDDPLLEIETDKAIVEVPAPVAGRVINYGGKPGDTLHVGDVLAIIDGQDASYPAAAPAAVAAPVGPASLEAIDGRKAGPARRPLATPAVRKLARDLGVDLGLVQASGGGGRITAQDVQQAVGRSSASGLKEGSPAREDGSSELLPFAAPVEGAEDERIPLRGLRKRVAEAMTQSWRTIPHITGMDEIDASELVALRERLRSPLEQQGVHLGYLPIILKAVVAALKLHPAVNASLDDASEEIVLHHRYNIGIATATPEGLIVPVVHNADRKTIRQLALEIHDMSEQARQRSIGLAALQGGTFTITNFGSLGGWLGTPIIRPGEAAILGVGRIQDRPWAIDGRIEVRPILALSFSADHRLIDGDVSTAFMRTLSGFLSQPLSLFAELI